MCTRSGADSTSSGASRWKAYTPSPSINSGRRGLRSRSQQRSQTPQGIRSHDQVASETSPVNQQDISTQQSWYLDVQDDNGNDQTGVVNDDERLGNSSSTISLVDEVSWVHS